MFEKYQPMAKRRTIKNKMAMIGFFISNRNIGKRNNHNDIFQSGLSKIPLRFLEIVSFSL
jgi:hypothetical protein